MRKEETGFSVRTLKLGDFRVQVQMQLIDGDDMNMKEKTKRKQPIRILFVTQIRRINGLLVAIMIPSFHSINPL